MDLKLIKESFIKNQLPEAMGIDITEIKQDSLTAQLKVDQRHLRPGGIMNGGVSLLLIETVGSFSSYLQINPKVQNALGIQVNANHISVAREGDIITAKSHCVHKGRTTHIWDVTIVNQEAKLISSGRITMLITDR